MDGVTDIYKQLIVSNSAGNGQVTISSTAGVAFMVIQSNTANRDATISFRSVGTTKFSLGYDASLDKFRIGSTSVDSGNFPGY